MNTLSKPHASSVTEMKVSAAVSEESSCDIEDESHVANIDNNWLPFAKGNTSSNVINPSDIED
jgi:hypothetical protein